MRGMDEESMIRKRDTAGKEQAFLAGLMNDPDANRGDVEKYIASLVKVGQFSPQEALQILRTLPETANSNQIRQWAESMFAAVMSVGVHSHAAFPVSEFPPRSPQSPQASQRPGFAMSATTNVAAPQSDDQDGEEDQGDEEAAV